MDFHSAQGPLLLLIEISAAIGAVAVIWTKVLRPIWRFLKRTDSLADDLRLYGPILLDLAKLAPIITAIAREFRSDSGSTLKDQLNKLEATTARLESAAELVAAQAVTAHASPTELP